MHTLILAAAANVALGALLGAVGGLLGIGGGLIAIPVLGYLYGFDQHLAQGTALVMIAANVVVGVWRYHQRHRIDFRAVATMSLFSMAATWAAAKFASRIGADSLQVAFAVFLILLAGYFGFDALRSRTSKAPATEAPPLPRTALPVLGVVSGAMSGFFTIGGGLVIVPALVSLFRMEQIRAQGMALALVVPSSIIALLTYGHEGHVAWSTGLPLALGGVLSVSWGVKLAHRLPALRLRILFCLVLLATAGMMLSERI
jgi:uncharacterized membrane protein YfcA